MNLKIRILTIVAVVITSFLVVSMAHSQNWTFTNGPYRSHEVKDLTASKVGSVQTIYAADVETLKVTTDGGTTWSNTGTLMLNPLVVASHPTDATIVHVAKLGRLDLSTDGGAVWLNKILDNNLVPLRISHSVYNTNIWFLGTDTVLRSGTWTTSLYRTSNGGESWTGLDYFRDNAHTNTNDVIYHPSSSKVRVGGSKLPLSVTPDASTDGSPPTKGVWYSADGGANWTFQSNQPGGTAHRNVSALAYSYNGAGDELLIAAVTWYDQSDYKVKSKLYQSGDVGSSWSESNASSSMYAQIGASKVYAMKVDPSDYNVVGAATDNGFAVSTNRGGDWTLAGPSDIPTVHQVLFDKVTSNKIWIGASAIYTTTNLGTTWSDNEGVFNFMNVAGFTINGSTAHAIMNSYTGIAKLSSSAWDKTPRNVSKNAFSGEDVAINFTNTQYAHAVGDSAGYGVIYVRDDGGDGWKRVYTANSSNTKFYTVVPNKKSGSQYVYAGGTFDSYNFILSTNRGVTWGSEKLIGNASDAPVYSLAVDYVSDGTIYAGLGVGGGSGQGTRKSTNHGVNWGSVRLNNKTVKAIAMNPSASQNIIYFGTTLASPNAVYRSNDALATDISNGFATPFTGVKRMLMHPSCPNSTDNLWVISGDGQKIYKTWNACTTWVEVNTSSLPKPLNDLKADPTSNENIYIATAEGVYKINPAPDIPRNIQKSGTTGQHPQISWSASPESDVPTNKYKVFRKLAPCGYIGNKIVCDDWGDETDLTPNFISSTSYTDNSWTITTPNPWIEFMNAQYYVKIRDNNGSLSDASASVYFYVLNQDDPTKTAIKEDINEGQGTPKEFALYANYPNPFNPLTQIKYALPEDAHVILKIYDVLGREVTTLVNEHQEAGYKQVHFDAGNLPSGMYFYKIHAGKFSSVKKMLLLK